MQTRMGIGFYLLLVAVGALMLYTVLPYLQPFVMAFVAAVVTSPLYERVRRLVRHAGLASLISTAIVILVFLVPLYLFVMLALGQFAAFAPRVQAFLATHSFALVAEQLPWLQLVMPGIDIAGLVQSAAGSSVEFLKQLLLPLAAMTATAAISVVLFVFMLLFMYPAKDRFVAYIKDLVPLGDEDSAGFVDSLIVTAETTIKSSFAAALVQAFLSFALYLVLGVPAALFWFFAAFITSLLPFGSGIVNVPMAIGLFVTGHPIAAVALLVWQIVVVANADNVVRMEMLKYSPVKLPELLTLVATLGGLVTFGFFGIIYGPLIAVMFVFMLELYRKRR